MPRARPRIAVVDDERPYAWAAGFALGDDFDVVPMTSPRELVTAVERGEQFDLILSDVQMPEMGGVQLYRLIRLISPPQSERVFFVTGFLDDALVPAELRGRLVEKPTTAENLVAFVRDKLGRFDL
jgi:CheY-like chemotaxis protein